MYRPLADPDSLSAMPIYNTHIPEFRPKSNQIDTVSEGADDL
jgi:hypothetical protein